MKGKNQELAKELMVGAWDLHTHSSPSHFHRALDDFQLLEDAERWGMAGVMIKCHYEPTGARAELANSKHPGFRARALGSLVLNYPVGGLNPYAIESALKMGACYVWMPTRDAWHCVKKGGMSGDFFQRPGIKIMNDKGALLPVVYDIFDVIRKYNACLGTGHLSLEESIALCRAGVQQGVRMVLTHPEWPHTIVPLGIQQELTQLGVWIEKDWVNIQEKTCTAEYMAHTLMELGPQKTYLVTDRGQANFETPAEGLFLFLNAMLENGVPKSYLNDMVSKVPEEVIDH